MNRIMRGLIPTTALAMAVTACGGGPDIDKVKADFENPTGSAKDKNAVIAANGKQNTAGNNSALSLAGGGVPGLGLSAGRGSFAKYAPIAVFGRRMVNDVAIGLNRRELRVQEGSSSCFESSDIESASAELQMAIATGGEASASVSFSADLASCGEGTGTIDISMDMSVSGQVISYDVEMTFSAVCEESGNCVDGSMAQQATLDFSSSDIGGLLGSVKSVSAWDLTATYVDNDGTKSEIKSKGGLRIGFNSDSSGASGRIEYLEYVNDSSGEEVSYVIDISATSNGEATLSIRCKDGELNCTFNENTGAGACMGTISGEAVDVTWSDAEYEAVVDSDDFKG